MLLRRRIELPVESGAVEGAQDIDSMKRNRRSALSRPASSISRRLSSAYRQASVVASPYKDYIRSSIFQLPIPEMKLSTQVRPITYLKANAAEVIRDLAEHRQTLVITQNGEAKAVMQDVASYEQTQEALALLKILALGNRQIENGKVVAAADVISKLRRKRERKKRGG